MATATLSLPIADTVAQLISFLGDVPPERIRLRPTPGAATEEDVIEINERRLGLCELIDGVLVEKTLGYYEAMLAGLIIGFIREYLTKNDIGFLLSSEGMIGVASDQVRLPDVCVFLWNRFPNRKLPPGAILHMVPDLSIEVLSKSNRPREMQRKLEEMFSGGAQLVWHIDPEGRTVRVYTAADQFTEMDEKQSLDGGTVLPGFSLPVASLFVYAEARE
jgi:Uma2 family endonuclease